MSTLTALQEALAAEHACVYGYGVVGARADQADEARARSGFDAHRARRDALDQAIRAEGAEPVAALGSYDLPEPTPTGAGGARVGRRARGRRRRRLRGSGRGRTRAVA